MDADYEILFSDASIPPETRAQFPCRGPGSLEVIMRRSELTTISGFIDLSNKALF